ncbi:MFS transporter [Actinokineospora sp. NBRC 105648]|uniref:MFS transporter n=1 Tax=Actinokineospora sp. NBRC 105648 TaxID=3032206 RepID=UPI0024A02E2C|nr:MFS transporter [Actinokineospora sp. NBRC 105648]GLZ37286.1 MFS transporter [Actinokineospora sp. NBRC 105648]
MSRVPLVALLAANALSICGTTMTLLAVPWFVLQTTGSPARTGLVAGVEVAGTVVAAVLGGPVVDRLGRRAASVLSDLLGAAAVAAVPLLFATTGLPFGLLLALTGVLGLVSAPGVLARSSLMPGLISRAGVSAERAAGAYDGVSRGAKMLGAPLAGVLIAIWGAQQVLLVDAGTFLASALLVGVAVPAGPGAARGIGYLARMRMGLDYLRGDRLFRVVLALLFATNMIDTAFVSVLAPVYARDVLHSSVALGLVLGTLGGGALLGTLAYTLVGPRLSRARAFALAFLVSGAPRYVVLFVEPGLPAILAVIAVCGFASGALNPILGVLQYERVPEGVRPMVVGLLNAGSFAGMPLGALFAGLAVQGVGLATTLAVSGVLYLVITLGPFVFPVWRGMDRRPAEAATAAAGD